MEQHEGPVPAQSVAGLRKRIEDWRRRREKRCAMPEELWAAAVAVAERGSVYGTARALGVSYATLRWRVAAAELERRREAERGVGFVELLAPASAGSGEPAGVEVELSAADGAKMTVRAPSGEALDVAGLARGFWGRGA